MTPSLQQADINAFGILLWQLITGKNGSNKQLKKMNLSEQDKRDCPNALLTCWNQCCGNSDASKKASFEELYEPLHSVLLEYRKRYEDRMKSIPDGFLCPITQDIMKDPVMLVDGHSYERKAIVDWLQRSNRSPLTNEVLVDRTIMIDNYALKSAIGNYLGLNNGSNSEDRK